MDKNVMLLFNEKKLKEYETPKVPKEYRYAVSEIFRAVQGEGQLIGRPTTFIRLGGCDYRCLVAGTQILRYDLTSIPVENVQPGERILGYARQPGVANGPLRLVETTVEQTRVLDPEPTIILELEDGTLLESSPDHRWWVEELRNNQVWKSPHRPGLEGNYREAQDIQPGMLLKGGGKAWTSLPETARWKAGYLRGAIDGDGDPFTLGNIRFRVTDIDFFEAVIELSQALGVPFREVQTTTTSFGTKLYCSLLPVKLREKFERITAWNNEPEFLRGYLAGLFDAEGTVSTSGQKAYVTQNRTFVLDRAQRACAVLAIPYRLWHGKERASRLYFEQHAVTTVMQIGIRSTKKRTVAANKGLRGMRQRVVTVRQGAAQPLYDLQTGTGNFVANGMVSHNCRWPVSLSTPIVTYDGRHVAAGSIRVGDELIGLSCQQRTKDPVPTVRGVALPVKVVDVEHALQPCVRVEFQDHAPVIVGQEHYFFRYGQPNSGRATPVSSLRPGTRLKGMQAWRMRPGAGYHKLIDKNKIHRHGDFAEVTNVTPLGEHPVAAIKTDAGSFYDANGILHKNCDSLFAVLPEYSHTWARLTPENILRALEDYERQLGTRIPRLITLSGGNPAIQPLQDLLTALHENDYEIAIETQGTVNAKFARYIDYVTLSPKPPSAGNVTSPETIQHWVTETAKGGGKLFLKVVVFDKQDWEYAREIHATYPGVPMGVQVGTYQDKENKDVVKEFRESSHPALRISLDLETLNDWTLACEDMHDIAVLPQLHAMIYGHRRGV